MNVPRNPHWPFAPPATPPAEPPARAPEVLVPPPSFKDGKAPIGVVFGTYNRDVLLKKAVASVWSAAGNLPITMFVVDGGSSDNTRPWLETQPNIVPIYQELPLTGATKAFNKGFARAIAWGCKYVFHFNDDAEICTPGAFEQAVAILEADPTIGEVAFEFDLRGPWNFEYAEGNVYGNFGMVRVEAGMAVARAQGDPTGRMWWNECYRTYGADCEFGIRLWKLGYKVHKGVGLRVHDCMMVDNLRKGNDATDDQTLYNKRVNDPALGLKGTP